jgi:hypothetical protein
MIAVRNNRRKWVIRSQVRLCLPMERRGRMLFTDYMAVGGCLPLSSEKEAQPPKI